MLRKEKHTNRRRLFYNPLFSTRPLHSLVCPRCGTVQSPEQDWCCSCKTAFWFLDETGRFASGA